MILIGEMLKQAERRIDEGLHPRILTDGFDIAKAHALDVLEKCKVSGGIDRAMLLKVAHTSLRTKVHTALATLLTEIVTDAVYGNFDIILDHFSRYFKLYTTPRAPCNVL